MNDQRSLLDQLRDVARLADQNGHYDAADWIRDRVPALRGNAPKTRTPDAPAQVTSVGSRDGEP